jgi:SEC-C motif-containing protein
MHCPCGTNKPFSECCEPFLKGQALPETAEKLMRSRYTAFAVVDVDYIKKTLAPEARKDFDAKATRESAQQAKWKELKILSTEKGSAEDTEGVVEFTAVYEHSGETIEHHETAQFRKEKNGQWLFVDGDAHTHKEGEGHHHHERLEPIVRTEPKIGRNDPCSCGSKKKYKKCCGANAA